MNHVPDDVLDALDEYGQAILTGSPSGVSGRLRTDLRLQIDAPSNGTARCRYEHDHTNPSETLRAHGSYVTTIADNVDDRLRSWGIEPPPAYEHTESVDGIHRYEGHLQLPGGSGVADSSS